MYQSYPGEAQMPAAERRPAPNSVRNAMKVMYAGAALSLARLVVDLVTKSSLKADLEKTSRAGVRLTATQLNTAVTVSIVASVIVGLISIGLWILVARSTGSGRKWAQVTGTVLFGLDTLALLAGPPGLGIVGFEPAVAKLFTALVWLAGLVAVVLIWRGASRAFFSESQR
jgi:hypothetical protein